jgi:hypothetical protein
MVRWGRYLTKMCDQVVALLSADHSASIVWNDEDETSSAGDSERLFTFEVAETIEQEDTAVLRPGFQVPLTSNLYFLGSDILQMNSNLVVPYEAPPDCSIDPTFFAPRLLPGETVQGLLTAIYIPPQVKTETFDNRLYSQMALSQLL